ncbi:hypothetical protein DL765_005379 [Monosporascus sp. GIB2]|nr:hypothetical protein DL765_005379 [Monosporascus sp. GIB2]
MSSDLFSSPDEARTGSLGVASFIRGPPLPNIVAEWTALLPLVTHLAGQRNDYIITGEVALSGRLPIGLFPSLGTFSAHSRLLTGGTKFLDHASTRGGSSRTVWDVSWGSVFPCANGAVSSAVISHLLSRSTAPIQRVPERLPATIQSRQASEASSFESTSKTTTPPPLRRHQVLHVFRFSRTERKGKCPGFVGFLDALRTSELYWAVCFLATISLAVFLSLVGAYGTTALVLTSAISEVVAWSVKIRRPSTYLVNSESHDAFMLLASHQNATEWNLFTGDRGVVDSLLNKPMIVVPEGAWSRAAASWFWSAHLLQLVAMTFAAAQKGWDGVSMVALLAIHLALRCVFNRSARVDAWFRSEGLEADVKSFEFGGRIAMMGALQILGGGRSTRWMDDIIVPHPRREAWLKCIRSEDWKHGLAEGEQKLVASIAEASVASANFLAQKLGRNGPLEP